MKVFIQIFLVVLLIGCQSKDSKNYQSKISGKWLFVEEYFITRYDNDGYEEPPPPPRENLGFNFYSKDSCEANYIFVEIKSFDVDYYKPIGRKTVYKIDNDSLKVFDRSINKWKSVYIMRLDSNNLTLNYNNAIIKKFVRVLKD